METLTPLTHFMERIDRDPRIRVVHIALFTVLYQRWLVVGAGPLIFFGRDLMNSAKISSSATYHRAIRSLDEYGYIKYEPSFSKTEGSKVYLG
jgi:hypothetical protein